MSKRKDIEIIRRELKISFKDARKVYKNNGESLIKALVPFPVKVKEITRYNTATICALKIYPQCIEEIIPPERILEDLAQSMIKELVKFIKVEREEDLYPWSSKDLNKITYRGYLRILREEGGYYENGERY